MRLILASQSPRRKELLGKLGYDFDVIPSDSEEIFDKDLDVDAALEKVAYAKAKEVQKDHPDDWIISADTIVVHNGEILGKPKDECEAMEMLLDLSGNWHDVKTGVCILTPRDEITFTDTTKVEFFTLSDEQILDYVKTKKPLDKAGAYGIQEVDFVEEIDGDFDNVVGLPTAEVKMIMDLLKVIEHPQVPEYYF